MRVRPTVFSDWISGRIRCVVVVDEEADVIEPTAIDQEVHYKYARANQFRARNLLPLRWVNFDLKSTYTDKERTHNELFQFLEKTGSRNGKILQRRMNPHLISRRRLRITDVDHLNFNI